MNQKEQMLLDWQSYSSLYKTVDSQDYFLFTKGMTFFLWTKIGEQLLCSGMFRVGESLTPEQVWDGDYEYVGTPTKEDPIPVPAKALSFVDEVKRGLIYDK